MLCCLVIVLQQDLKNYMYWEKNDTWDVLNMQHITQIREDGII